MWPQLGVEVVAEKVHNLSLGCEEFHKTTDLPYTKKCFKIETWRGNGKFSSRHLAKNVSLNELGTKVPALKSILVMAEMRRSHPKKCMVPLAWGWLANVPCGAVVKHFVCCGL